MEVLQLDVSGRPQAWISSREAAVIYATGGVGWTLGEPFCVLRGGVQLNKQLRDVQVEDVLGREPVVVELDRVGAYLQDSIVLVTGAGGSIGSELCRQIARVGPRLLVMLDQAEDNLFQIDREMVEERHCSNVESVLADCKEPHRMLEVMQRFKPAVVFHAAAYKHVPLMEANPLEAVRNNAIATRITAETAAASKVERFVLISTDKSVNPQTVMGASKAMAEWIVEGAGEKYPQTRFQMLPEFKPAAGAAGWAVSNPPIFSAAPLLASLEIFRGAGMDELRAKSLRLTAYAERMLAERAAGQTQLITPAQPEERGCQLSLRIEGGPRRGRRIFDALGDRGIVCDWREPDVIRIAPVPLYNRFIDVFDLVEELVVALKEIP